MTAGGGWGPSADRRHTRDVGGIRLLIGSLLAAAWFFSPMLLPMAFITASSFGGGPSEAERAEAEWLLRAAVALAFLAPVGAALVAWRHRALRVVAMIGLGLALLAALALLALAALS